MSRVGAASHFSFDARQRAIVKIHYFRHAGGAAASLRAHARYIGRDAEAKRASANRDKRRTMMPDDATIEARSHSSRTARSVRPERPGLFYDAKADGVDGAALAQRWAEDDRRHFRIILSAENGGRLRDLQDYTRAVMAQAEAALSTKLEWFAADHWDTDNPHTHIVLRGRREDGRDLVIPKDYVRHGLRAAAQDVATRWLGERRRSQARSALDREARAHRPSWLDRLIASQLDEAGCLRLAELRSPDRSPVIEDILRTRAREIERLGLANLSKRGILQFEPGWQDRLKAMELHLDIRKSIMRGRALDTAARQTSKAPRLGR